MYQAFLALHHDIAAHQLDMLVGDGHAEVRAAVFPRGLHDLLLERTENTADKRRLHTDAGIVYAFIISATPFRSIICRKVTIISPLLVNLTALNKKLMIIWLMRSSSPRT